MSEFWKSIPKIYCKFCNAWYQDNKSSKDFHERSFKHKSKVQQFISSAQRRQTQKQAEEAEFKKDMLKIEQAAMIKYQKDVANDPLNRNLIKPTTSKNLEEDEIQKSTSRFGDEDFHDNLRKEALEAVTNKLKKKHEWFESKTIEGKVYYYNRNTMETRWKEPKNGFVSIEEQKEQNITDVPGDQSDKKNLDQTFKHEQFKSGWKSVDNGQVKIDLELPKFKTKKSMNLNQQTDDFEEIEFKEKVLDKEMPFKKKSKDQDFGFKNLKLNNNATRRVKTDD